MVGWGAGVCVVPLVVVLLAESVFAQGRCWAGSGAACTFQNRVEGAAWVCCGWPAGPGLVRPDESCHREHLGTARSTRLRGTPHALGAAQCPAGREAEARSPAAAQGTVMLVMVASYAAFSPLYSRL